MRVALALTAARLRLVVRNRTFLFFTLAMPMAYMFFGWMIIQRSGREVIPYLLASVAALTVAGTLWGISLQLVMFREQGILRRFRMAPVGAAPMLLSSIFSNYVMLLPTILIQYAFARWVFHMSVFGNLWGVLFLVTLGSITFASMGLIIASVTNSMQETQVICQIVWMLFMFLSGATIPLPFLPKFIQVGALFLPATYLVTGFQRVMIGNQSVFTLGPNIVSLVSSAVLAFLLSQQLFRWDPEEKVTRRAKLWAVSILIPFLLVGLWEVHSGKLRTDAGVDYRTVMQRPVPVENKPQ